MIESALQIANDVPKTLAVCMTGTIGWIRRTQRRQTGRCVHPRRRQSERRRVRWLVVGEIMPRQNLPDTVDQLPDLALRGGFLDIAPTPPRPFHGTPLLPTTRALDTRTLFPTARKPRA
jgi:hypothetical protein